MGGAERYPSIAFYGDDGFRRLNPSYILNLCWTFAASVYAKTDGVDNRPAQVICPSGSLLTGVSSPICKNISISAHPKSLLQPSPSHPTEGRIAIVTDAGRDAVDAAAFCARWDCRAGDEPVSDQQHADERCCCGRRNRVVLTPRRWRQVRGVASAQPGLDKTISADDGGKRARSPGRARRKPLKPLRAGMPGVPVRPW